jgi:hypothetical protein
MSLSFLIRRKKKAVAFLKKWRKSFFLLDANDTEAAPAKTNKEMCRICKWTPARAGAEVSWPAQNGEFGK